MKEMIILFGAGNYAKKVLPFLIKYYDIDIVVDNDEKKWGNIFAGKYAIKPPNILLKCARHPVVIAVDNKFVYDTICTQLGGIGKIMHVNKALLEAASEASELFYISEENKILGDRIRASKKNVFVFTAPSHANLGDQAQSYCIEKIIRNNNKDAMIWIFDEQQIIKNYYELLYVVKQNVKDDDLLYVHSGYRLTDLYIVSETIVEMLLDIFEKYKIVFLPQTIYFTNGIIADRIAKKMTSNITIMCRDEKSYKIATEIFPKARNLLFPDVVTSLIGRTSYHFKKNGILICMRKQNDGESIVKLELVDDAVKQFKGKLPIIYTDTTKELNFREVAMCREKYVYDEIERYAHYSLIITDRFHGAVFSLVANTPVIVLPTRDHKVICGVKWLCEAGYKSVFMCEDTSELENLIINILNSNIKIENSAYFYDKFFKNLDLTKL